MTFPRLVATDLDGTLLRRDGSVSARTLRALRTVRDAGAEIVVVTARPPRYLDRLVETTGLTGTAVCSNGALVYDLATRTITSTRPLALPTARLVADRFAAAIPEIAFAVEAGDHAFLEPSFLLRFSGDDEGVSEVPSRDALWNTGRPLTKLLAWSERTDADTLLSTLERVAPGLAQYTHSGGHGLLEISATGVTKADTLARLCAERSLTAADVVAFGDMPNDLAILRWAGAGYAMGNAHPDVLAAASHRTLSHEEDGVAVVLERLYGAAGAGEELTVTPVVSAVRVGDGQEGVSVTV
ncbi:HAD family hydrolase [Streptomyces sp. NBC_00102]|uniref:HAD family hydrolase n=1 Tax=Streptomyces sp. NBC_00102 TaxID=2975652 RepID=UPI002253A304|nr:HAD hydrolase family protein [Streptomyces sp. NBC_00102]MCX5396857.1 HAD hydrolase family protein [Streptomyces sp. NBC_00102]